MSCNEAILQIGVRSGIRRAIKSITEDKQYPKLAMLRLAVGKSEKTQAIANRNTKMPGYTYGASAWFCQTGMKLADIAGTVCSLCYAKNGNYIFPNVKKGKTMVSLAIEYYNEIQDFTPWVLAMTQIITKRCIIKDVKDDDGNIIITKDDTWFRWHDSGDIQGVLHLQAINQVALNCPDVSFWLPTKEGKMVKEFLKKNEVASNLCIRISGYQIGKKASAFGTGINTSTVNYDDSKHHCIAPQQGGSCDGELADCRNCWNKEVPNVNYILH